MSKIIFAIALIFTVIAMEGAADASMQRARSTSDYSPSHSSGSGGGNMMLDFAIHHIRDTRPDGLTDTGGRLSIGGMLGNSVGIDFVGMRAMKTSNYLIGADLRLAPTDWFFLKGGMGAYSDKTTREFKATPLAGIGIKASLVDNYYFLSEFSYFERSSRQNVTFGAGVGITF